MQDRLPFRRAMGISRSEDFDGGGGPSTGGDSRNWFGGDSQNWFEGRNLWAMSIDISEIPNWLECRGILSYY